MAKTKAAWTVLDESALPASTLKLIKTVRDCQKAVSESKEMKALTGAKSAVEAAMAAGLAKVPAGKLVSALTAERRSKLDTVTDTAARAKIEAEIAEIERMVPVGAPTFAYNFGRISVAYVPKAKSGTTGKGGATLF